MSHVAEASSPHLIGITQTGRYLIVLPRHLHLLRRSRSMMRLAFLVLGIGGNGAHAAIIEHARTLLRNV